jgi:hypothetical protein
MRIGLMITGKRPQSGGHLVGTDRIGLRPATD